jgi:hypothetical protein
VDDPPSQSPKGVDLLKKFCVLFFADDFVLILSVSHNPAPPAWRKVVIESRTETLPVLPKAASIHPNEVGGYSCNAQIPKSANLFEILSRSMIPYHCPLLYESFLELRSLLHRIRLLRKQESIRLAQIGPVHQLSQPHAHLVPNKRIHARSQGIQRLLSDFPWMTTWDCQMFLSGWDAAEESCGHSDNVSNIALS